jgi:branched-chain amino acid transport system permease protein
MAFIISAGYAGAAGALFVIHETYIHPTTGLFWITSGDFVIMTVLGGTGSLIGPVFGALIFEYVSNVISGVSLPVIGSIGSLWRIVLGAVFIAVVWVFPQGVWGAIWDGIRWLTSLGGGGDDR